MSKIANHRSAKLSELDMKIVKSVPPGGNWKNIPEDIPSKRIAQIRESFKKGLGSRSTYYGRLKPEAPSYTINTYFNRPGNGCHIHYEQDRVISQREAARFQTFPDNFEFHGPQGAINTQIGNAVPPLLAFQIAKNIEEKIGTKGIFVDLFCGAGGMGLGFKWAGWKPLIANDIDAHCLVTYKNNVHDNVIHGSLSDSEIFDKLVSETLQLKTSFPNVPLWILGGPPCQGFSTAGKKRSMDDERNSLFLYYKKFIEAVRPDGFVFENVAGLLNMDKGAVFKQVQAEFSQVIKKINGQVVNTEYHAIPQRRKRVILIGTNNIENDVFNLAVKTAVNSKNDLFKSAKEWITAEEAISDLPPISQAEDGSHLSYATEPQNPFQQLMRGYINPDDYLSYF